MDLVRAILQRVEESSRYQIRMTAFGGWSEDEVNYHLILLGQAGLLEVNQQRVASGVTIVATVGQLTWEGHEFLDAARNDTAWQKAKEVSKQQGASLPFKVLQSVMEASIRASIGI